MFAKFVVIVSEFSEQLFLNSNATKLRNEQMKFSLLAMSFVSLGQWHTLNSIHCIQNIMWDKGACSEYLLITKTRSYAPWRKSTQLSLFRVDQKILIEFYNGV